MTARTTSGTSTPKIPTVRLKIRVKLRDGSRRFLDPVFSKNGKLRPLYAVVNGTEELHPEGVYALRYMRDGVRVYQSVGSDPDLAITAKLRVEHSLMTVSLGLSPVVVEKSLEKGKTGVDGSIADYLADTQQFKSKSTHRAYTLTLRGFRKACDKPVYLEDITRRDILRYMAQLKEAGKAPRTVSNRIDFLKIFFNHFKLAWPMLATDKVKYTEKEVSAYNREEIAAMLCVADRDEADLVLFLLQTGAREQEVQFACWTDINFSAKTFTIREKLDLRFTPKDKEEGSIPIPDCLVDALAARRKRYPTGRVIFPGPTGAPEGHYLRIVKSLAFRAGLNCGQCYTKSGKSCAMHPVCSGFILHKFRKTFATMHHESGVPVRKIQAWLRHSSLDTTLRYLANSDNNSEKTRSRVNATFASFATFNE